jgi:hypothetical protein
MVDDGLLLGVSGQRLSHSDRETRKRKVHKPLRHSRLRTRKLEIVWTVKRRVADRKEFFQR